MKDTMRNWIVKINKDTSWSLTNKVTRSLTNKVTKEHRKIWSKKDVEDFLDWQENRHAQAKGSNDERSSH
jgi:hypothetical protein